MFVPNINTLSKEFTSSIKNAFSILIVTHKNPDGDGLAACLALKLIINELYKKNATILLEKKAPDFLSFLNVEFHTQTTFENADYDLVIGLDCHESFRTNLDQTLFDHAGKVIFIDHHEIIQKAVNDNFLYYVDIHEVSTGVILHKMFYTQLQNSDSEIKKYYADCIYTTILNDTDNFLNSNVDKQSYETCAQLMDFGLVPNQVIMDFLLKKPMQYYQFIGSVLSTLEAYDEGKIIFLHSTLSMLKEFGLDGDATSKMMRWTKGIESAKIQVYFQEAEHNLFRISFRSDYYDVAELAKSFNGGGHKKAAGCEVQANLKDLKLMILEALRKLRN